MNLTERIKTKAIELGFDLVGVAPAVNAPHARALRRWLAQGYQAEMGWLAREPERRESPRLAVPGAESVVVVGLSYFVLNPEGDLWQDPARGRIARYAWGLDYHDVMLPRLRQLGDFVEAEVGRPIPQRAYVDTGPVLERDFAALAGLGFIGKNTLLINPGMGSYLFLGEVLTGALLDFDDPAPDGGASCVIGPPGESKRRGTCGGCTRCLEICPTHAFPAPYVLNSHRCISYLTIEHKGSIPVELRPGLQNWIYGCDECQEVCPWVRRYSRPTREQFLRFEPELVAPRLTDLLALDEAGFRARFKGSPIKRTKRRGLLRNVAVALGNWGHPSALPALERATADPEPLIREHAGWAIERITGGAALK
ncbi:MAG: tRNA epoxyqueuosine(34) reductase QueG [Anaerolineae bacterium]